SCDPLKKPDHGSLECHHPLGDFSYNSSCTVQCEEGYELTALDSVHCTSAGLWSAPLAACKAVRCGAVPRPAEGSVSCDRAPAELTAGSRCDFQCTEGYVLEGSPSTECLPQGLWSEPVPKCKGKTAGNCRFLVPGEHTEIHIPIGLWLQTKLFAPTFSACEPLSSPENGSMDCSHGAGIFTYNTSCHFSCLEGWSLNGSRVLECSHSGAWSASLPTCEASDQASYVSVGIAATSASLLSTASFLLWLARRF
ncbi:LYAM2 protein, partial [Brachypodius atriceps]|nr:LYAM2 protein [Brachypodius atriceps]